MSRAGTRSPRRGFTLPEILVVASITVVIAGTLAVVWDSSRRQERNLSRHMDVQRGLRGSMMVIQRDLREMIELVELEREPGGTLKSMHFRVPGERPGGDGKGVTYVFERGTRPNDAIFKRNGRQFFEDSLSNFEIHPFTLEDRPREVTETQDYNRINLFKVKLTFLPGKAEGSWQAEQRTFTFSLYPRIANLRRKATVSRFNLLSGRFGRAGRAVGQPPPELEPAEGPVQGPGGDEP